MDFKYLFLDYDGVINTDAGIMEYIRKTKKNDYVDPKLVIKLNTIVESVPDLRIVISSAWRLHFDLPKLKEYLVKAGFKYPEIVIDCTPSLRRFSDYSPSRGKEIHQYCLSNGINMNDIVVLDDLDLGPGVPDERFVMTNMLLGITDDDVSRIINLLK